MFFIVSKYFVPKGFNGMTIFPFVILKERQQRENRLLTHHEQIHIRQQLELFVIPFFAWYFIEFLLRWLVLKDRGKAYREISFEKEAYAHEADFEYLKSRRFWQFTKYL